jgi:hypothetical protein
MTAGCSVVIGAGPIGTHSSCSVTGNAKRNASCSTYSTGENVPPGEPGVAQICSVQQIGANKQGSCSVHAANVDTTHVRTCSVQSRPRGEGAFANCSVLHLEGTSTGSDSVQTCSVIGGSGTDTSYCSVMKIPQGVESNVIKCSTFVESGPLGQPGKHRCSTYVDHMGVDNNHVQPSRCSVLVPQHGGGIIVIPANPLGTECVQP